MALAASSLCDLRQHFIQVLRINPATADIIRICSLAAAVVRDVKIYPGKDTPTALVVQLDSRPAVFVGMAGENDLGQLTLRGTPGHW